MTKQEFVERVAQKSGLGRREAGEAVDAVIEAITEALKNRERPRSVEELKPRIPSPPGTTWLAQVWGQWPGDESDEEIFKALEEMS